MSNHPSSKPRHGTLNSMTNSSMNEPNQTRENTEFTAETIPFPRGSGRGLARHMGKVRANRSNWLSQVFMRGLADMRLCTPSVAPCTKPSA
ncbi:hypothetical protein [Falsihalocynthiibacter arcticus]|uniref:hypothetical protein n=1 Tax=Falsihalocynthiibacter arcticus TaxID=1579316 RepID=UPI0012E70C98|nr:hypothetical protein [Falsihalocynthiibacter arcticus]